MRFMKACLLIAILTLVSAPDTSAAPLLLNVVTEEFPPYNFSIDGKIGGIATTVVTETLKRAGIHYHLRIYPWKRAYETIALNQKNVLIYSIYKSVERGPLFAAWIGPIMPPAALYLYKLKSRTDIRVDSLEDAKKYRIGVTRADYSHVLLKRQGFVRLDEASDALSNARKFLAKRIDLIPTYELTLAARLKQLDTPFSVAEKTVTVIPVEASKIFMAVSRGSDPELIKKIKTAFEWTKAEGVVDKALNDYLQSVR